MSGSPTVGAGLGHQEEPAITLLPMLCPRTLRVMAALLPEVDDLQSEAEWAARVEHQLTACAEVWVPAVLPSQWRPLQQGWWHRLLGQWAPEQRHRLCLKMSLPSAGAALTDARSAQAWADMQAYGVGLVWHDLAWPQGWPDALWRDLRPDAVVLGERAQALLRRELDDAQATKALERQVQAIRAQGLAVWAGPLADAQALYRAQQLGCSGVWGDLIMQPMSVQSFMRLRPKAS
ncbi:hypothetical protein [Ideonella sp.]|jgi:hypothetical protein|uniref:hypothetical protein n=1 Tax=Ideonella sp. TaxID=1929293 RepID=UPI0037C0CE67